MDILLCTDNNYVMPTGVLMTSVSMNNNDINYHIIVSEDFSDENQKKLEETAERYQNVVSFYRASKEWHTFFPMGKDGMPAYISISTYYRLLVTHIFPSDLHKVLYLDGDMIVRKTLLPLWNVNVEDVAVGVVHDMDENKHIEEGRLPYPMNSGYFNAGMMLINLDYWRKHDCVGQCVEFLRLHSDIIRHHDQDVLNAVLYSNKKWLPLTYNFQSGFLFALPEMINYPDDLKPEIMKVEKDPVILHFSCEKPWGHNCMHPQRFVWEYYKSQSLWKDVDISVPMTLKEKISFFLKKNNYWFFEHKPNSLHRNIYRRVILKK